MIKILYNISKSPIKKFLFCFLLFIYLVKGSSIVFAQKDESSQGLIVEHSPIEEISVTVNNQYLQFDVQPQIINGRTLVPLRIIFEALGASVDWDDSTKTVTGKKDNNEIVLKIDNNTVMVNNEEIVLDSPATIINGRTLIPARFVAESLGSKVEWEAKNKVVIITSKERLADSDEVINIVDEKLLELIRLEISKPQGNITVGDVQRIITLDASKNGIVDLDGIEHLGNLKELYLFGNDIKSIEALKELKNLTTLDLWGNNIHNIESLADLTQITSLDLAYNYVIDISHLENLKRIKTLSLFYNPIVDINVLVGLEDLEALYLEYKNKPSELNDDLLDKYEALNQSVEEIIEALIEPDMSEYDMELVLHDYIVLNTSYDVANYEKNTVPEISHSHFGVFMNKVAVCDGYAKAMYVLLSKVGIESFIIEGEVVSGDGWENHAWNIVNIEGIYYHLDVTHDDPRYSTISSEEESYSDVLRHYYFNLSDAQMRSSHKWEGALYKSCVNDNESIIFRRDARFIIDEQWVYANQLGELYKIKIDGTEYIKMCEDDAQYIELSGEWIYYSNKSDEGKLYRIKKDASGRMLINDDKAMYIKYYNDNIYYINRADNSLYKLKSDNTKIAVVKYDVDQYTQIAPYGKSIPSENYFVWWMDISDDIIYFTCFKWEDGNRLYNKDLKEFEKDKRNNDSYNLDLDSLYDTNRYMIAGVEYKDNRKSIKYSYNENIFIVGDWIYYLRGGDENSINAIKKDASENIVIFDHDCTDMKVLGDWIYYLNSEDNKYYRIRIDGTQNTCLQ